MSLATADIAADRSLDAQLWALANEKLHSVSLPVPVKRFTEFHGSTTAIRAMQLAVDQVLSEYWQDAGRVRFPIRAQRLCDLLDAELRGIAPSEHTSGAYAVGGLRLRSGHSGKLFVQNSKVCISIPPAADYATARISVAHELGHALIHRRGRLLDEVTMRLPSSPEEEALAEYGGRLMLMPTQALPRGSSNANLAEYAVVQSNRARVTVHAAVARLGDPDFFFNDICGAILWRLNRDSPRGAAVSDQLTPRWHLCPGAFVPVGKCKARAGSLVSESAAGDSSVVDSRVEDVRIGTFNGRFRVDALAWGSIEERTRLVLSVFRRTGASELS